MTSGLHFLIIDDDELLSEIHKRVLENAGHKATIITSSKEALAQIPDLQADCILSDLVMPDIDGFELFRRIQKMENIKKPKFIVLTAKAYEFDHRYALQLGVDGYLTKPVNVKTFVNDILEIMNEKKSPGKSQE